MSFRSVVLALLMLAGAPALAAAEVEPEVTEAAAPEWQEFHFADRGFAASFPGEPKATSAPVEGQNPLLQHDYQVSVGNDTVYSVVVFEYPEGKAPNPPNAAYFSKVVTAYAKGSDTRVRKKGPTLIDRRQGFEAVAEDGRGKLNHRIEIVANADRIYMLVTAGPKNHANSEDAKRFRESFRLLGGDPPPDASSPGQ